MSDKFSRHLLTTKKKFIYVAFDNKPRLMKRNKALSKWFRDDILNDFVYVYETEHYIYFSDASSMFACALM